MAHFSRNIKACCLYVIRERQDQIWAKIFCIPKNMHSRTLMFMSISYTHFVDHLAGFKTNKISFSVYLFQWQPQSKP